MFDEHDDNLEPEDMDPDNEDFYDPNDPGHDDDAESEQSEEKKHAIREPDDEPEREYPNIPVTGERVPAEWTVSGDIYQDGTDATAHSNVGIKCFVRRGDHRILRINRVHTRRHPETGASYNVDFNEDSIFVIHTSYPGDHPKVIRANGSESPLPIETKSHDDDYNEKPKSGPEHELGKRPQPVDPDDHKPSDYDPDSEDESKPD